MVTLTYIIAGIVLLGLCIFVHELGHLLGGKVVGIKAKVFSLGYGPGFLKKQIGDTTYQLGVVPLGGFCQFYGEDPSEERSGKGYEFLSAHPLKRIFTVAMGPLFNLFFGILIFLVMNLVGYTKETNQVAIPEQLRTGAAASPAYEAGVRDGDRIVKINGSRIMSFSDIQSKVIFSDGKPLVVTVEREGKTRDISVTPRTQGGGRYEIGVSPYGKRILVADMIEGGAAAQAGLAVRDEIVSVDGVEMTSEGQFLAYVNSRADKKLAFKILRNGEPRSLDITPRATDVVFVKESGGTGAAAEYRLYQTELLGKDMARGRLKIDGVAVKTWDELVTLAKKSAGATVTLQRDKEKVNATLRYDRVGLIGIFHAVAPEKIMVKYGFGEALVQSVVEPWDFIVLNVKGISLLIKGKMSVRENLSGPIRIAKIAGDVVYYKGMEEFILLMAKISIILMVMNFLPIPAVDGSHLVFYTVELIRGKPLSQKLMERIQAAGFAIIIVLGILILINDISMLPIIQRLFY